MKQFILNHISKQLKKIKKNSYLESIEFTDENLCNEFNLIGFPGDIETKMKIQIQFLSNGITIWIKIDSAMFGNHKEKKQFNWIEFDIDYIPNMVDGRFKYPNCNKK